MREPGSPELSPHTRNQVTYGRWLIIQALTTDDNAEIDRLIHMLVQNDAGTGYIHESIHKDDERIYTRPWFAWVNSLFSEMLMKKVMKKVIDEIKDFEAGKKI